MKEEEELAMLPEAVAVMLSGVILVRVVKLFILMEMYFYKNCCAERCTIL
jgi:hypothetical protein